MASINYQSAQLVEHLTVTRIPGSNPPAEYMYLNTMYLKFNCLDKIYLILGEIIVLPQHLLLEEICELQGLNV